MVTSIAPSTAGMVDKGMEAEAGEIQEIMAPVTEIPGDRQGRRRNLVDHRQNRVRRPGPRVVLRRRRSGEGADKAVLLK